MIRRHKKISLFIACLCTAMSVLSIYNLFTASTQNNFITALITFNLCVMMAFVSIWDYDYLSKKK